MNDEIEDSILNKDVVRLSKELNKGITPTLQMLTHVVYCDSSYEVLKLLLMRGADVNEKNTLDFGSILAYAIYQLQGEAKIKLLLRHGATFSNEDYSPKLRQIVHSLTYEKEIKKTLFKMLEKEG